MINQYVKPINIDINGVKSINWTWVLQRAPILALGIDSSYNVAKYTSIATPVVLIQVITGVTFDLIFVGMIALADQFRSDKVYSNILFWVINVGAMLLAAVFGTLAYSNGSYADVTAESMTRGIAFPVLGLLYNLYYHAVTSEIATDKRKAQLKEQKRIEDALALQLLNDEQDRTIQRLQEEQDRAIQIAERKALLDNPYVCEYCPRRFETSKQRSGHMSRCSARPAKIQ